MAESKREKHPAAPELVGRTYRTSDGTLHTVTDRTTPGGLCLVRHHRDGGVTGIRPSIIEAALARDEVRENPANPARLPSKIQSLIFDASVFTPAQARSWAKNHGFDQLDIDEKTNTLRLRQRRPASFESGSLETITLTEGVKAVIGRMPAHARMNPAPHLVVWVKSAGGFLDDHGGTGVLADAWVTHSHDEAAQRASAHDGEVLGYDAAETRDAPVPNPSKFKWQVGQAVVYVVAPGKDAAVPATWNGTITSREPNIDDGLYYSVLWKTPTGETHEGLYHESDLAQIGARSSSRENPSTKQYAVFVKGKGPINQDGTPAKDYRAPPPTFEKEVAASVAEKFGGDIMVSYDGNHWRVADGIARKNPHDAMSSTPPARPRAVGQLEITLVHGAKLSTAQRDMLVSKVGPKDILVRVDGPTWTQYGEVDADGTIRWPDDKKITAAAKKEIIKMLQPPWTTANTSAELYEERDNLIVRLLDARGKSIVDVSDNDARDLFTDGFLDVKDVHGSLVKYANERGLKAR